MRRAEGVAAARALLKRVPLEEGAPPRMAERLRQVFGRDLTPEQAVDQVLLDVEARGDAAILDYTHRIDGVRLRSLAVPREEVAQARNSLEPSLLAALELAAERVRAFHQACLPRSWLDESTGLGQRFTPLDAVGVYVPGGTASYPSTVLHTVIPARVAGLTTVVIATPPGPDGAVNPAVLAAADIAGADYVFRIGGAQAIAAMAIGTDSVPRVDKIVGPGNLFVTIAKRKVFGRVGIDGLHGPTETMIIADDSADAATCAADLLAQAEHDVLATPVLLTTSRRLFDRVPDEVERQLVTLERRAIARESMEGRSVVALVGDIEAAMGLANEFAPEHLCLLVQEPARYADLVRHAGGLFIGEASPEVLGDYTAGPSHTMPTGGTARFGSALGVHDFLKITSVIKLTETAITPLAEAAARIARAEGLTGHARAAEHRLRRPTAKAR